VIRGDASKYPASVTEFERAFAAYVGCQHGLTFCNGTSCLEAALFAVGVQPGDRVLVPAFTFHATISPVLNAGAEVGFCDLSRGTLNVDIEDFDRKATAGTKAAIVTHLWGNPVDMTAIMRIAASRQITIIEDCSHAHGAEWGGRRVGSFGSVGFFSLQSSKAVSSGGEGGIAVTNDRMLWERMLLYGHFDRVKTHTANPRHLRFGPAGCGHKARMHPIAASLAMVDLRDLEAHNEDLRRAGRRLGETLAVIPGVTLFLEGRQGGRSGGFFGGFPVVLPEAATESVTGTLTRLGFRWSKVNYQAWHRDPFMRDQSVRRTLMFSADAQPLSDLVSAFADDCPNTTAMLDRLLLIELQSVTPRRLAALASALRRSAVA
jgi:dTDP-4-amino-4,6-dideoxygalactose transaminase